MFLLYYKQDWCHHHIYLQVLENKELKAKYRDNEAGVPCHICKAILLFHSDEAVPTVWLYVLVKVQMVAFFLPLNFWT